jgi:hypothetical protein
VLLFSVVGLFVDPSSIGCPSSGFDQVRPLGGSRLESSMIDPPDDNNFNEFRFVCARARLVGWLSEERSCSRQHPQKYTS